MKMKLSIWIIATSAVAALYAADYPPMGVTARPKGNDVLPAPSSLNVSLLASNKVGLVWTSNSNGEETGFRLEYSLPNGTWKEFASVGRNITNYTYTSANATSYWYRVRGHIYSTYSEIVSNSLVSDTSFIWVSWNNISDIQVEFCLERKFSTNAWKQIAVMPYTAGTYQDTNVVNGIVYSYRIRSHAYSTYSNVDYILPAPGNLRVTDVSFESATLVWDYPLDIYTDVVFEIYRSDNGTDNWQLVGTVSNQPPATLESP